VGHHLRNVPATGHTLWWPYVLFGYAFMVPLLTWIGLGLLGSGFVDGEIHPAASLLFGVIFALPMWTAARWLAPTPYHVIVIGCWVMVGLWGVHLVVSIGTLVVGKHPPE
jgi:hypothetical protein